MKKILYIAVAMMAALSSCSSSEDIIESNGNDSPMEFTATIVNETGSVGSRSTLGTDSHPNWENTDKVNINGAIFAVTPNPTDPTKADLKFSSGALSLSAPYKALFAGGDTQADDWDGTTSSFKLPSTYTYSPGKFNMPMYAESNTKTLNFYNICGVLAVKVTSAEMASVTSVTITSDKAICGTCTISAGTDGKYYATAIDTNDASKTVTMNCTTAVTPTADGTIFYVPVAVSSDTKFYVTVYGEVATAKAASFSPFIHTQSMLFTGKTIARSKIYTINFATSIPMYSVSSTDKVQFTNGNLYSDTNASTATASNLHFESSQIGLDFDYVSGTTSYTSKADHVGHFYWNSTIGASVVDAYTNDGKNTFFAASNLTVAGTSGLRVLTGSSSGEWHYLLNDRTNASNLRKYNVTVTDGSLILPHCLVIAPDNFVGTLASTYTVKQLKEYSLVCLPNAGRRMGTTIDRLDDNGYGGYSSSTPNGSGSFWSLWFTTTSITDDPTDRSRAFNVRLVKTYVEEENLDVNSVGAGAWTESGSQTVYMNGYAVRIAGTTSDLCFNMSQSGNTLTIIAVPTSSTAAGRTPTISPSSAGSSTLSGNICTTTLNNITTDVTVTY